MKIILKLISLFCLMSLNLTAQSLDINVVDTEVYPRIKVYVTVTDSQGEVVCHLPASSFRLKENNQTHSLRVLSGESTETSIGILLDNSGSMDGVIDNVREAAQLFINLLGGTDRACTYSFDDSLHQLYSMIDVSRGSNKSTLANSLENYKTGGGTSMYDAISGLIAQELAGEKDRKKAIVALTDGSSSGSLQTALQATGKHNVAVYAIAMGGVDERALGELTEKSGGVFYALKANPSKEELEQVYRDIKKRLSCQYTLSYDTPDVCPDGSEVPIEVFVDDFKVSKKGKYKRPHDPARIVHNLFFAPAGNPLVRVVPEDAMECERIQFQVQLQATSCSDRLILENILVRAYDLMLDNSNRVIDRQEVAASEPVSLQSNGDPQKVIVEWDSRGYTGERHIELVIDPTDSILEKIEEDNLVRTRVNVSTAIHDLYIENIEYSPSPGTPCGLIDIKVKVSDGCACNDVITHDILLTAKDDQNRFFGNSNVTITSGQTTEITFSWDPQGRFGHLPFTFKLDPNNEFGQEQTLDNNTMQALIEVSPVLHELSIAEVTHPEKRFFVGDRIPFSINVKNAGICPDWNMEQQIRIRLKDPASNRGLAQSKHFSINTQNSIILPIEWNTTRNDAGPKQIEFSIQPSSRLREQDPPGRTNNTYSHEIEILPMPHDLTISEATISPNSPVDGSPATITVVIEDNARFPGIRLEKFNVKAFDRYTRALVGRSDAASISSQQRREFEFPIDTGGMAGEKEILIIVDPDNNIEELTPEGLDGENNNQYILKVTIKE